MFCREHEEALKRHQRLALMQFPHVNTEPYFQLERNRHPRLFILRVLNRHSFRFSLRVATC